MKRPREEWLERVDRHLGKRLLGPDLGGDAEADPGRHGPRKPQPATRPRQAGASSQPRKVPRMFDWLIVGAGFAGSALAERLASQRGDKVLVIDKRPPYRRQRL